MHNIILWEHHSNNEIIIKLLMLDLTKPHETYNCYVFARDILALINTPLVSAWTLSRCYLKSCGNCFFSRFVINRIIFTLIYIHPLTLFRTF